MTPITRIVTASVTGLGLLAVVSGPALAAPRDRTPRPKPVTFQAVVVDVAVDDDAATADSLTVEVTDASRRTRAVLGDDAELDVEVGPGVRVSSPRRVARTAGDLRVGDWVQVKATVDAEGVATASRLTLRLPSFEGTVEAADETALSMTVEDANKAGDRWLAGNDDPAAVDVEVTDATRFDDDVEPVAGDAVEVVARPSADDPAVLEAVAVEVEESDDDEVDAPETTTTTAPAV